MGIIYTRKPRTQQKWTEERREKVARIMQSQWTPERRAEHGNWLHSQAEERHSFEGRIVEQAWDVDMEHEEDYTRSVYRIKDRDGQVFAFVRPDPRKGKSGYKVIVLYENGELKTILLSPGYTYRLLNLLWEELSRKELSMEVAELFGQEITLS